MEFDRLSSTPSETEGGKTVGTDANRAWTFEQEIQAMLGKLGCIRLPVSLSGIPASSLPSVSSLAEMMRRNLNRFGVVGLLPSGNVGFFYFGPPDSKISAEQRFNDLIAKSVEPAEVSSETEIPWRPIAVVSIHRRADEIGHPTELIQEIELKLAARTVDPNFSDSEDDASQTMLT